MLMVALMVVIMCLTSGCVQIYSDISVKADLSGVWKAKVFSADPSILNKAGLEERIKEAGIKEYKISETTQEVLNGAAKTTVKGFEVILPWANSEELKNIVVLSRLATVGGNQNGRIKVPEPLVKDEKTGLVSLDLGNATDKVTLRIEGAFDKNAIKAGKIIDDSTIEFTMNDPVVVQFKPKAMVAGFNSSTIGIILGGIIIVAGGALYYQRKKIAKQDA